MNTRNKITWTVILLDITSKARFGLVIIRIGDFKFKLETSL